ncbi:hypothetical protein SAMN05421821_101327 [Mucilaginibacter lappiensis]|uniref:Uncharacterized protein n=1 Tax=Mucilaginibacter lappiensis TaxID=354630 RepID=A0ABR6PDR4_9SPHI|nr:hypothetical protein [Mucilaginibacter lappiensis]MBB6107758.1 hypothetical protein [Mucilaginibacter lappiensis]SIP98041.1 hypothetical protein SAMN05421821_101327 [Mucilaginibacter lappiensis]
MISFDEYIVLPEDEKAAIAMTQGNFVDFRYEKKFRVALYRLRHFYAEVYYDGALNTIDHTRAFTKISQLAPYINL